MVSGLSPDRILDVKHLNQNGDGVHKKLCASKDEEQIRLLILICH